MFLMQLQLQSQDTVTESSIYDVCEITGNYYHKSINSQGFALWKTLEHLEISGITQLYGKEYIKITNKSYYFFMNPKRCNVGKGRKLCA